MKEHVECPLYEKCGGCQRLNQSYSQTLVDKLAYVNRCFQKEKLPNGKMVESVMDFMKKIHIKL